MNKSSAMTVRAIEEPGFKGYTFQHDGCEDVFLSGNLEVGDSPAELFGELASFVSNHDITVVSMGVFGLPDDGRELVERVFGEVDWPLTCLDDGEGQLPRLGGIQLQGITGADVTRLYSEGRVIGTTWSDCYADYCKLGDLRPNDLSTSKEDQAQEMFDIMTKALNQAGMNFSNVVRTWFWNDRILDWYDGFNQVRTNYFNEHKVFDGLLPASTGIGARNDVDAALVTELIAMNPRSERAKASVIISPKQCSACDYGSSFSRATEIETCEFRQLFISGTASIAPCGETVHVNDVAKQVDRTMEVVEAILESRGMAWSNVSRAIIFFRHAKDYQEFDKYCERRGISIPVVCTSFTVCRQDLLFEIELDAAVNRLA